LANFNDTLLYLRGNTFIDYEQLGLKFRLYSCEVLFNRGLCYIYLQQIGPGMQDLEYASKEKVTPDHDVINDAIKERAEVSTNPKFPGAPLTYLGLHCLLYPSRSCLPPQRGKGEEPQGQRLPRQVSCGSRQSSQYTRRTSRERPRRCAVRHVTPSPEELDEPQPPAVRTTHESELVPPYPSARY
jgi:hypothetical protein